MRMKWRVAGNGRSILAAVALLACALSPSPGTPGEGRGEGPRGKPAAVDLSKIPPPAGRQVDFAKDVRPIFAARCYGCHGPEKPKSKWVIASEGDVNADDTQVSELLDALHPLRATKYLEKAPTTQPSPT